VAALHERGPQLREQAHSAPASRGFAAALGASASSGMAVIAEIKRASPSAGQIRGAFDPATLAAGYANGGAACLSVLTDREFFQGASEYLGQARSACPLPALRKDFIIDPLQVYEARALGADCLLLIVAALDDGQLAALSQLALDLGMDLLVEAHDEAELDRALALDERCVIGINNRNLKTFVTTLDTTIALRPRVPDHRLLVSESGIYSRDDLACLRAAGVHAVLIGESLMRQPDPGQALAELLA
ncbi:MAG: indole-3-glycerol phosphate synthase TrpC, partial [Salinisphaera sp.]|nr:indole-3-glycerol phosphate synthase TrpC [Salinisphaera sp.]